MELGNGVTINKNCIARGHVCFLVHLLKMECLIVAIAYTNSRIKHYNITREHY